jgi:23S rRNA pseudouridine1911/1915/1917 synthase
MKHIGHPLFNDLEYGGDKILKGTRSASYTRFIENCFELLPGQALHAKTLGFFHPILKKQLQFDSALPSGFQSVIEKWENYVRSED